ncbi:PREDICTED: uncharacterized protein LOC106115712 [Papilio xuthus]|uniref:Uncharacterized protein LOC106115712 n=1 Tax=Papilio xuthus TaxID=66420 RepID=A0AAJ7E664_PAPXU|nr:PREDICTED: uncharacterized protein LOC106115712 [Papilio xuthus]
MYFVSITVWISLVHLLASEAIIHALHVPRRTRSIGDDDKTQSFKPNIPPECEEIGICDNVPSYPHQYVSRLIDQITKINQTTFNMDILELTERFGPEEENLELCRSEPTIYTPQAARSTNGRKWYYIVNKRNYEAIQTFRVEVCVNKDGKCKDVASFALGNQGYCKQKYILRKMVAIDYRGNTFEDYFIIPSCCSCVYRTL